MGQAASSSADGDAEPGSIGDWLCAVRSPVDSLCAGPRPPADGDDRQDGLPAQETSLERAHVLETVRAWLELREIAAGPAARLSGLQLLRHYRGDASYDA